MKMNMNNKVNQDIQIRFFEYLILSLIIFLSFIARLYKINSPVADWHSFRQADTASVTRVYLNEGLNLLFPRYHDLSSVQSGLDNPMGLRFVEFPLYNLFHYLFARTLPFLSLDVTGRLTSIFFCLISVFLIFLITRKLWNYSIAILTSFFFGLMPFNVFFTRAILPESLAIALASASIYFFMQYCDWEKKYWLIFSAVALSLSILVKPFTIFYGFVFVYLTLKKWGLNFWRTNKDILVFAFIVLTPFFLWRAWIMQYPPAIPRWKWMLNVGKIRFRPAFFRWIFGERIGRLILGMWGLIPLAIGILKTPVRNFFVYAWSGGALLYTVVFAAANVQHDYYQLYLLPPISIFLGVGAYHLLNWKDENALFAKLLFLFSVIMMFGMSTYQVKEYYKINHPEIVLAGDALDKIAPKDALVIASYNGDTAFLYQTKRKGWPVVDDSFENLIKKGASFYVSVNYNDPDTKYLSERYKVIEDTGRFIIIDLREPL